MRGAVKKGVGRVSLPRQYRRSGYCRIRPWCWLTPAHRFAASRQAPAGHTLRRASIRFRLRRTDHRADAPLRHPQSQSSPVALPGSVLVSIDILRVALRFAQGRTAAPLPSVTRNLNRRPLPCRAAFLFRLISSGSLCASRKAAPRPRSPPSTLPFGPRTRPKKGIPKGKALRRRAWEAEPPSVPAPATSASLPFSACPQMARSARIYQASRAA